MTTQIVTVNVTQTLAPKPNTLQRTGVFVSQGATTLSANSTALLTQFSDLTAILNGAITTSSINWATGVVTVVTSAPHGIPTGDTVPGIIAGVVPTAYNGTFQVTSTGASTFTYPLASNPGTVTTQGAFTLESVQELVAMATTYFAQGSANAIYVLELGAGTGAQGVTALNSYIVANPQKFYAYAVTYEMSSDSSFLTFAKNYESTTSQVYFWVKEIIGTYGVFKNVKSVVSMLQDTTAPVTEWTPAAMLYNALNYNPSDTNKVAPMAFQYIVGVTAFTGTNAQCQLLKTANVNYVGTGAEGGISNTLVLWGVTADGQDYTYWYSVDWVQININLFISNAIINGSNNPINPLYYNQAGINRLQKVAQGTMNSGIAYGLVLSPVTVNAVPFTTYVADNPSDYAIGKYAGLSVTYTPARGFIQIVFNVNVSSFALA
jgi:hypothetical protein